MDTLENQSGKLEGRRGTYHSTLSEGLDLLDSARSTLLEGNTVQLYPQKS